MCGIFFVLNNKSGKNSKITNYLRDAFLASQVRGVDGSGLSVIGGTSDTEKEHPFFYKHMMNASGFVEQEETKKGMTRAGYSSVALGHVRAATEGKLSNANAHPFKVVRDDGSYVIGVHNGTLTGWERGPNASEYEVDSAWALRMIADQGIKAFEYFNGAFAFIWYDSREADKVYMARNDRRPLNYVLDESRKVLFGASEPGMLGWLAERNNIVPAKDKKGSQEFYFLAPDKLYTFDLENVGNILEVETLPKYDYNKLPVKYSTTSHYDRSYEGLGAYGDDDDPLGGYPGWQHGWSGNRSYNVRRRGSSQQDTILNAVKRALGSARSETYKKVHADDDTPTVIDAEAIERRTEEGIRLSIERFEEASRETEKVLTTSPIRIKDPLDSTATRGEIIEARKNKVRGQVVSFTPSFYDAQTQVLLGEFEITLDKEKAVVLGELRHDIKAVKAQALIKQGKPILMAVIGMAEVPLKGGKTDTYDDYTYVVANLTNEQRELTQTKIAEATSASQTLH